MGDVLLNGRSPVEWELPALARARECALERDSRVLAGLLAEVPRPVVVSPRPLADLLLEYS